jgi:hypothetical protein
MRSLHCGISTVSTTRSHLLINDLLLSFLCRTPIDLISRFLTSGKNYKACTLKRSHQGCNRKLRVPGDPPKMLRRSFGDPIPPRAGEGDSFQSEKSLTCNHQDTRSSGYQVFHSYCFVHTYCLRFCNVL